MGGSYVTGRPEAMGSQMMLERQMRGGGVDHKGHCFHAKKPGCYSVDNWFSKR